MTNPIEQPPVQTSIPKSAIETLLDDTAWRRRRITSALVAVSGRLQTPYTDQPDATPWSQYVAPAVRNVHTLIGELSRQLRHEYRRANLLEQRALRAEDEARRLQSRLDALGFEATE